MHSILTTDLSTLLTRRRDPPTRRRAPATPAWFGPTEPPGEAAPPGYGWFESSAELRAGLAVIEGPPASWAALDQGLATIFATVLPSSITASA